MTQKEYTEKKKALRKRIWQIESDLRSLDEEYKSSNFDASLVGRKVKCWRVGLSGESHYFGEGMVSGVEIGSVWNDICYKINKIKKDGTMSGQSAGYWGVNKIEVVE